jgi:6,7-dimethyl-8-ribityllumazine synthase
MHREPTQPPSAEGLHATIVVSGYHSAITEHLLDGARTAFVTAGGCAENLTVIDAPGAWELPQLCAALAAQGGMDAIVALGCVITGETTHDRVIADAIANGLMRVSIDFRCAVGFGVLTCGNLEQAAARAGGDKGNKGEEAMVAAIATAVELAGMDA